MRIPQSWKIKSHCALSAAKSFYTYHFIRRRTIVITCSTRGEILGPKAKTAETRKLFLPSCDFMEQLYLENSVADAGEDAEQTLYYHGALLI